jgi:hypothetical protein
LYDYISTRHQQQQQQQQHLLMGRNASDTDSHLTAQEDLDRLLQRLRWIDALPHRQYSRVVCHFDVNLDPFIFGGGVTLCDGLAGHCPVVVDTSSSIGPAHDWLRSIGFVTAGRLQSVHRIGAGIAQHVGDTDLAVDVSTVQKGPANDGSDESIDGVDVIDQTIAAYVREAVRLAKTAQQRDTALRESLPSSIDGRPSASLTTWKQTRRRVDDLIYGSTVVLAEYVRFFQRIVQ